MIVGLVLCMHFTSASETSRRIRALTTPGGSTRPGTSPRGLTIAIPSSRSATWAAASLEQMKPDPPVITTRSDIPPPLFRQSTHQDRSRQRDEEPSAARRECGLLLANLLEEIPGEHHQDIRSLRFDCFGREDRDFHARRIQT